MKRFALIGLLFACLAVPLGPGASERAFSVEGQAASLRVDLTGGVLTDFHLAGDPVNPLRGMGHFLCLDRWGPPSEAEAKNGMPFHGEASKVEWRVTRPPERRSGGIEAEMLAELPLGGLQLRRLIRIPDTAAVVLVREEVTDRNRLGRIS